MTWADHSPSVLTGLALGFGGYSLFALRDAAVKWLVARYPVAEIMADIATLDFAAPVLAVILSALFLGERVSPARWTAVGTGFAGVDMAALAAPVE